MREIQEAVKSVLNEETKKSLINKLYKVNTKGLFRDENWFGYQNILKQIKNMGCEVISSPSNVQGYKNGYSVDGNEKRWDIQIVKDNIEVKGCIRAFAAGSVRDPWSAYDLTITLW